MTHEKVCVVCGKAFTARRKDAIYCSNECRHKDYFKKHYHPRQPIDKVCAICGKPFQSKWVRAKYCSDECRREADRQAAARQYARRGPYREPPGYRQASIRHYREHANAAVAALTERQCEKLRAIFGSKSAINRHYFGGAR